MRRRRRRASRPSRPGAAAGRPGRSRARPRAPPAPPAARPGPRTMGSRTRSSHSAAARTIARSCARSASGCSSMRRRPRWRVPRRNGGVLSPPKSSTRTVATRPRSPASTGSSARRWSCLGGPAGRLEEGELGPDETGALGPRCQPGADLGRGGRVGQHRHGVTVAGDRGQVPVGRRPLARALARRHGRACVANALGRGRQDRPPLLAVDHDERPRGRRQQVLSQPHDHRDAERARHDRGVRGDRPGA